MVVPGVRVGWTGELVASGNAIPVYWAVHTGPCCGIGPSDYMAYAY